MALIQGDVSALATIDCGSTRIRVGEVGVAAGQVFHCVLCPIDGFPGVRPVDISQRSRTAGPSDLINGTRVAVRYVRTPCKTGQVVP